MFTIKLLACIALAGGTLLAPLTEPVDAAQTAAHAAAQIRPGDAHSMWALWPR